MVVVGAPEATKTLCGDQGTRPLMDGPRDVLLEATRLQTVPEIENTHFRYWSEATIILHVVTTMFDTFQLQE